MATAKKYPVYHEQLRAYYSTQHPEWTPEQKGAAIWKDLCRIKQEWKKSFDRRSILKPYYTIKGCFIWEGTVEGFDYWHAQDVNIGGRYENEGY